MPKHTRMLLISFCLLTAFVTACGLWLRAQQRQFALNRALIAALIQGEDKRALVLVYAGADPNTRYKPPPLPSLVGLIKQMLHRSPLSANHSPTALSIACGEPPKLIGDYEINPFQAELPESQQLVRAMLAHSAQVNTMGENSMPPLMWAVTMQRSQTVPLLLEYGADVNARYNFRGDTVLIEAVLTRCRPDLVRFLLDHGASVNMQNDEGTTVLQHAVEIGADVSIIKLLMAYGADVNLPDHEGKTPLICAQQAERPDLAAILKQYGARGTGKLP